VGEGGSVWRPRDWAQRTARGRKVKEVRGSDSEALEELKMV
jgi:hypothetical protein